MKIQNNYMEIASCNNVFFAIELYSNGSLENQLEDLYFLL